MDDDHLLSISGFARLEAAAHVILSEGAIRDRLVGAGVSLLALAEGPFTALPKGRERFCTLTAALTATAPDSLDPHEWGALQATVYRLDDQAAWRLALEIVALYRDAEAVRSRVTRHHWGRE